MRVLFLAHVLPFPLDAGSKIRTYYVLRYLAQSSDITLVSFIRPTDPPSALEHVKELYPVVHVLPISRSRWRDILFLLQSLITGKPFLVTRNWVPSMAVLVDALASSGHFDVIHADQLAMAPYALHAKAFLQGHRLRVPRLLLDQHDAVHLTPARMAGEEHSLLKRALLGLEARRMARYEAETCRRFDRVVWVTQQDRAAVEQHVHGAWPQDASSTVIPICVDPAGTPPVVGRADGRRVTLLGGLHYPPNAQAALWFAQSVFREVLRQVPDAKLTIIGRDPPQEVQRLRSTLPESNLDVAGYVQDLGPYLQETAVFAVPLLAGSGMRVKIIDAWMWGLPIISTSIGAEGIACTPGENIVIADTAEAFAEATVRLLQDPGAREQLGTAGRRTVEQFYDWHKAYYAFDEVYTGLPVLPSEQPSLLGTRL